MMIVLKRVKKHRKLRSIVATLTKSKYSDKIKPKRRMIMVQILERKKEYLANA